MCADQRTQALLEHSANGISPGSSRILIDKYNCFTDSSSDEEEEEEEEEEKQEEEEKEEEDAVEYSVPPRLCFPRRAKPH